MIPTVILIELLLRVITVLFTIIGLIAGWLLVWRKATKTLGRSNAIHCVKYGIAFTCVVTVACALVCLGYYILEGGDVFDALTADNLTRLAVLIGLLSYGFAVICALIVLLFAKGKYFLGRQEKDTLNATTRDGGIENTEGEIR